MKDPHNTTHENSPNREAPNRHERGSKKYKQWVDRENTKSDLKNLPFTFGKPKTKTRRQRRDIFHVCDSCQNITMVSKVTCAFVCSNCRGYSRVNSSNIYKTHEDMEVALKDLNGSQTD